MDQPVLELNEDYQYVLDLIELKGQNVFVTGRAGTGKSTLLKLIRDTSKKNVIVLAPTGIAALNVGGQTIHRFFKFPAKPINFSDIKKLKRNKIYKKMELLIIDEISMVRADLLDSIDLFLQRNRDNPYPFGGVQVVFFGDLFQLPPVVASKEEATYFQTYYDSPYFFSSNIVKGGLDIEMIELRKVYRQKNRHFLRLLEGIRLNQVDYDDLAELNERYLPGFRPKDQYITLSATNSKVNEINRKALDAIPHPEQVFMAKIEGDFNPKLFPTEAILPLKLGAQVMFIKNEQELKYVNGTIGQVVDLTSNQIKVAIEKDAGKKEVISVEKHEWEILKYRISESNPDKIETEKVGSFTQYPLKLAWAITIHKSQGKTFDKVMIDLGRGAFEHGQTYVAFSRCRTLEGIVLKQKLRPRDILTDERVVDFYEQWF